MTAPNAYALFETVPGPAEVEEYNRRLLGLFETALVEAVEDGKRLHLVLEHVTVGAQVEQFRGGAFSHVLKRAMDGAFASFDREIEDCYVRENALAHKISLIREAKREGKFYDVAGPAIRAGLLADRTALELAEKDLEKTQGYIERLRGVPGAEEVLEKLRLDAGGMKNSIDVLVRIRLSRVRQIFGGGGGGEE